MVFPWFSHGFPWFPMVFLWYPATVTPPGNGVIGDVAPAAAWASFLPIFTSHLGGVSLEWKHQTWHLEISGIYGVNCRVFYGLKKGVIWFSSSLYVFLMFIFFNVFLLHGLIGGAVG